MSCQFFDFPSYTELEINFPSNKLNVFLPAQVTLNKHPKVFILSRKLTEVTLAGSITRSSNSKLSNAMDAIKIEDIRGKDWAEPTGAVLKAAANVARLLPPPAGGVIKGALNLGGALFNRMFLKEQTSFLWPGHLNLAVSVYKEAKYQKSDFYLKNWLSAA